MAIRSGRFSVADATTEFEIIRGRFGAFYRIFNSGKKPFSVRPRGSGTDIPLLPTFSLDVSTGDSVWIIKATGDAVEGIYDYLDVSLPVRSGRFNREPPDVNPATAHPIIHYGGGADRAWYRIFNSGENEIILLTSPDSATPFHRIKKGQSFDFEVGASSRTLYVKSAGDTVPIDGIYEFLGRDF